MKSLFLLPIFFFIGPMTGAMLRGFQPCCLRFSLGLLLYLSPFLIAAYTVGLLPWFEQHPVLKRTVWWLGILIWCFGAFISIGHALS